MISLKNQLQNLFNKKKKENISNTCNVANPDSMLWFSAPCIAHSSAQGVPVQQLNSCSGGGNMNSSTVLMLSWVLQGFSFTFSAVLVTMVVIKRNTTDTTNKLWTIYIGDDVLLRCHLIQFNWKHFLKLSWSEKI